MSLILRLLGIRVTDLTREDAAAELYGFDVTVRWRPLILLPPEDRPPHTDVEEDQ